MNIAEKLITIAENEPKVFGAGYDNGSAENRNYINNTFSNVLKGTKVGKLVSVNDVSPIEHNLKVKLTSDTVKDFSSVEVYQQGKNILRFPYQEGSKTTATHTITVNTDGTILINGSSTSAVSFFMGTGDGYKPQLKAGETYIFSGLDKNTQGNIIMACRDTKNNKSVYFSLNQTSGFVWEEYYQFTNMYLSLNAGAVFDNTIIKPQLELGTKATEYVPPNIKTTTANADGTVEGFTSLPSMIFRTNDSSRVKINLEYNRDINKPKQFEKVYDGIIQNVTFDKPYTELYVKYQTMMGLEADVTVKLDDGGNLIAYFWGAEYQWYHLKLNGGSWETEANSGSDYMPLAEPEFYLGAKGITKFIIAPLGDVDNTTDTLTIYAM